jgi:hypothetical protein
MLSVYPVPCSPARSVYLQAGEELPAGSSMPARETSSLFDAPVAVAGSGVAAATEARIARAAVARCPASLLLCEHRQWSCRACSRKYRREGVARAAAAAAAAEGDEEGDEEFPAPAPASPPPVPGCLFCSLPLGPERPTVLFSPPCCS